MKKVFATLATVAMIAGTTPAMAGDDALYALGGVLGGIILGSALNNHPHQDYAPAPAYYPPAGYYPAPQSYCWQEARSQWDPYIGGYTTRYVTLCR